MNVRKIVLNWFLRSPITGSLLISFIILSVVSAYTYVSYKSTKVEEERVAFQILSVVKDEIKQTVNTANIAAHSVAMFIDHQGEIENFESVAHDILLQASSIRAVQLVPNGIISETYPKSGNEGVKGLNLFADTNSVVSAEAQRAIDSRTMYFAGPLELKQGGNAVIGRLPVFRESKFWGFVAIIIDTDVILNKIVEASSSQYQYILSFSKINPFTGDEEVFLGPEDMSDDVIKTYTFSEADWRLSIYNSNNNSALYAVLPLLLVGIILSAVGGFLTYFITKSSQKQYQVLFESSTVGILIHDKSGAILNANPKFCELFGFSKSQLKSLSIVDLHGQGEYSKNLGRIMLERILTEGSARVEEVFRTQHGNMISCEASASLIDYNGIQAVQIVFRDISAIRLLEKERIAILESITDGFFAISEDGRITFRNKTAAELFSHEGKIHSNLWELKVFDSNNELKEACESVLNYNYPKSIDMFCPEFERWLSFTVYPAPSGLAIYFKDITPEKKSQNQIAQGRNKALLAQSQLLSSQLNPHFIFNVLNSIQYYILDKDVEPALNFLSVFSKLVRRILYNSRKPFINLDEEIKTLNTYLELEKLRYNNKLEYFVSISENLDDAVDHFLPPMLVQPYVENSIIHAFDPSMEACKIEVNFSIENNSLVASIRDNGVGIKERLKQNDQNAVTDHKSMSTAINRERIEILNSLNIGDFRFDINDLKDKDSNMSGTEVLLVMPLLESDEFTIA